MSIEVPTKKRKISKSDEDYIPLPDPFPLPKHYPYNVEIALKRGKMTVKEKRRFISEVASAMLCYKHYPTAEDNYCVARSIVGKYPFLKAADSKPYVSTLKIMNLP